jgi:hypothetical protein
MKKGPKPADFRLPSQFLSLQSLRNALQLLQNAGRSKPGGLALQLQPELTWQE